MTENINHEAEELMSIVTDATAKAIKSVTPREPSNLAERVNKKAAELKSKKITKKKERQR